MGKIELKRRKSTIYGVNKASSRESVATFAARMFGFNTNGHYAWFENIPVYIEHDIENKQTYLVIRTHSLFTNKKIVDNKDTRNSIVTIKFPLDSGIIIKEDCDEN